jgi:DNA-binding CsgD family transcriptional regulator
MTSPWPESLLAFRRIWPRLAPLGRLVAVDLPGFGHSEGRTELFSPSAMAEFLHTLIGEWDLHEPHLLAPDVGRSCSYWPMWPCWMGLFFELADLAGDERFMVAATHVTEMAATRNPGVASFEGVALVTRGRSKGDLPMIAQASEVLTHSPRPLLRGFGAFCHGRALLAAGHRESGLAELDRAWDEYHSMDAIFYRDQAENLMREAGARRAKWVAAASAPTTGWSALTQAEQRVAVLIGAGRTNKQAAAELGVSVNTVGTHLRVVFAKLGIRSRVQLANVLHDKNAT